MATSVAGPEIERLIQLLARLPGLGPRSARRVALHLINKREQLLGPLSEALRVANERIVVCANCGNIDTTEPCAICRDPRRDPSIIVVVEDVSDLWALERAGAVNARYHVLGGVLSPLDGIGPEDLTVDQLVDRVAGGEVREVILATNPSMEGEATALYVQRQLSRFPLTVSRIARGLPVGGDLEYADGVTIAQALTARREMR